MASLHRQHSSDATLTKSGKLPVAQPATLSKFAIVLVMHICRKILLVETHIKVAIYSIALPVVSLVTDMIPFPKTYFARKDNMLNLFFVNLGWGWTCGLLLGFIYMTSLTYCAGDRGMVKRHIARMFIGTVYWFSCTSFFNYVDETTGFCSVGDTVMTKRECRQAEGGKWQSFDISGHAFLLIYSLLLISEEMKPLRGWERIPEILQSEDERMKQKLTGKHQTDIKEFYDMYTTYIRIMAITVTCLVLIWELMLLSTAVYFHNMPQKVLGGAFAVLGWFVTYRIWYRTNIPPSLPGTGILNYNIPKRKKKKVPTATLR